MGHKEKMEQFLKSTNEKYKELFRDEEPEVIGSTVILHTEEKGEENMVVMGSAKTLLLWLTATSEGREMCQSAQEILLSVLNKQTGEGNNEQ